MMTRHECAYVLGVTYRTVGTYLRKLGMAPYVHGISAEIAGRLGITPEEVAAARARAAREASAIREACESCPLCRKHARPCNEHKGGIMMAEGAQLSLWP